MTDMLDLAPAAGEMARLLRGISEDQLNDPTPCPAYTLGDLVDHVGGLSLAFTWAATKDPGIASSQGPSGDAGRLEDGWRARIGDQLEALALAWKDPDAWGGMTRAGGVDLPGEVAGAVTLNELVIHGWDVARASGQQYHCDPAALQVTLGFVTAMSAPEEEAARDGLFGPVVPVSSDASMIDRVIGLSGRDPSWAA